MKNLIEAFIFIFFLCSILPQSACAYLDPGTGAYILTVIVSLFVGALYALKVFWFNITGFFKGLFSRGAKSEKSED